jgi:hypothetical protein
MCLPTVYLYQRVYFVRMRKRAVLATVAVVLAAGAAFGLYWFQPWKLFTDTTVADTLTNVAPSQAAPTSAPAPDAAVVVRQGAFITHEHDTSGTVRLIRNPDGSHQLEFAGLVTSDGPDLRVWLTDQEVKPGTAGWRVFDDGRYVELGELKGNRGDQVYVIPAGVDPESFRSVSIWCKRFSVSFGAAELR